MLDELESIKILIYVLLILIIIGLWKLWALTRMATVIFQDWQLKEAKFKKRIG
jgi:hypothetical protein